MARILIIGGGVSGLSAGIYARLSGHEATVCERHAIAGGNLTAWDRDGYHIDNCIHWLTGTNPASQSYELWKTIDALGEGVEIIQGETLYTCEVGGERLSLYRDLSRFEAEMLSLSPADEGEIRAFTRAVAQMQYLCGIGGEKHNKGVSPLGAAVRLSGITRYYGITTGELSERFHHPLLRFFFRSFWGADFGAFSLVFVFAHFTADNGGIPRGSSSAMAKRITDRFRALGGTLLLRKEAVRIHTVGDRARSVTFSDGTTIEADYVILTGDPAVAFGTLLQMPMPRALRRNYEDPRMRRFSSYQCALACDLPTLPFRGDFIFEIPQEHQATLSSRALILREFSHEPSFSPEGKQLLQTLIYTDEETARDFIRQREEDPAAYREKKRVLAELLREIIEQKLPMLSGKLSVLDLWTPATYHRFTATEMGSWMSFALPSKKLPLRVSNRIKGLSNVILATQWQQSPGGLPIAAEGGRLAIRTVDRLERRRR